MLFDVAGKPLWSNASLTPGNMVQWLELWYRRQESWVLFLVSSLPSWVTLVNSLNLFMPQSSFLTGRIPWREEPGGLQSMRSQRVGHN